MSRSGAGRKFRRAGLHERPFRGIETVDKNLVQAQIGNQEKAKADASPKPPSARMGNAATLPLV